MTLSHPVPSRVLQWLAGHPGSIIDGRTGVPASSGEVVAVLDPGTRELLTQIPDQTFEDVDRAVSAARVAFDDGRWSASDPEVREQFLHRLADAVEADADLLVNMEILDSGKTRRDAQADVQETVNVLRYYAGWPTKVHGETLPTPQALLAFTTRDPIGVCAAITPWNFPLPIATYKLAPALACGNTMVLKPAELASLSTIRLCELALEVGIPDGVLNVVTGTGTGAGAALARHRDIDKIAFTGSTATGRAVMRAAAERPGPVSLELGGKSANVIFADADVDRAADDASQAFGHSGQVCVAGTRVLVQREVMDRVISRLSAAAASLVVGHGLDPSSDIGPVISAGQLARVRSLLDISRAEGATVVVGGETKDEPGWFVEPTVLTDVTPSSVIAQEEVFGPVICVIPFDDEDEAVRIANSTRYGLAAGVWTSNTSRALRMTRRLHAGTVWVNGYGVWHPILPFGGVKESGFGRELGAQAIEQYSVLKTSVISIGAPLNS